MRTIKRLRGISLLASNSLLTRVRNIFFSISINDLLLLKMLCRIDKSYIIDNFNTFNFMVNHYRDALSQATPHAPSHFQQKSPRIASVIHKTHGLFKIAWL